MSNNKANINKNNKLYQEYYERKRIAMVMEESNNSKIIVIPSVSKEGRPQEWLKIGGNSAYFYKYLVAPRLGKKPPTIHPDTDLSHRFKSGVIAIHWQNTFIKNMATLDLKPREESGLLIFEFKHTFTPAQIKKLYNKETEARTRVNQILKPTNTIPELYHLMLILAQVLPNKIRKMEAYYREAYGQMLAESLVQLFENYIQVVDMRIERMEGKRELTQNVDRINAILIVLNENHALDYSTEHRLGTLLIDIKNSIAKNIRDNDK